MDTSDIIGLVGLIVAVVGFCIGLLQYKKAQAWKTAEFVAAEVKDAFADPQVRTALHLLDWNRSCLDLRLGENDDPKLKDGWVADGDLAAALMPHQLGGEFHPPQVRIRLAFDELLGRFQRYEHFIEAQLVPESAFLPYLRYWLDLLCSPSEYGKSEAVLHSIWRYIHQYRYYDVQRFVGRFGYDITSFPRALTTSEDYAPFERFIDAPLDATPEVRPGGFSTVGEGSGAGG